MKLTAGTTNISYRFANHSDSTYHLDIPAAIVGVLILSILIACSNI